MTEHEILSIAIGVANAAVAIMLMVHMRIAGLRPPLPLAMLVALFALRAMVRLAFHDGEPSGLTFAVDAAIIAVLVILLFSLRRLVTSFVAAREAAARARVDYDEALFRHETEVAGRVAETLAEVDEQLAVAEGASVAREREMAITAARTRLNEVRTALTSRSAL